MKFAIPKGIELHEGIDGSGFKMTNSGEYFQTRYGKSVRKFACVVITATKEDILGVDVYVNEKSHSEQKVAQKHIAPYTFFTLMRHSITYTLRQ